jgi:hypothetical protein
MDLSVSQQGLCCVELVSFFVMNGVRSGGFYGSVSFSARTLLCGVSFFLYYEWYKVRRFLWTCQFLSKDSAVRI